MVINFDNVSPENLLKSVALREISEKRQLLNVNFHPHNFKEVVDKIQSLGYRGPVAPNIYSEAFFRDSVGNCCYIQHGEILIGGNDDEIEHVVQALSNFIVFKQGKIDFHTFFSTNYGVDSKTEKIKPEDLGEVIPSLYPDIDIDLLANDFRDAKEKLLILYGSPGTGKTSFIRSLMQGLKFSRVGYCKCTKAAKEQGLWHSVEDYEIELLIFDDLDYELEARKKDKDNSFVSNLLSFSDGILGNNTKIVITTNQEISEIDSAIIRPGRCFDFLVLNSLKADEARKLWIEEFGLRDEDFCSFFDSRDYITQADFVSSMERLKSGRKERLYIKGPEKQYTVEEKIRKMGIAKAQLGFS